MSDKKPRRFIPGKRQIKIIEALKSGDKLARDLETGWYLANGIMPEIDQSSINSLINHGIIKPTEDGLFKGMTQTYVLA